MPKSLNTTKPQPLSHIQEHKGDIYTHLLRHLTSGLLKQLFVGFVNALPAFIWVTNGEWERHDSTERQLGKRPGRGAHTFLAGSVQKLL